MFKTVWQIIYVDYEQQMGKTLWETDIMGNSLKLIIYVGAKFMQECGPSLSRVYCFFVKSSNDNI